MTLGDYLAGVIGLALVAGPLVYAAVRLRARLLPGWEGAPARLAEAVLGVSLLTVLLQLLGAIGILEPAVLIAAAIAIGAAAYFAPWLRPTEFAEGPPPPALPVPPLHALIALAGIAFVAAHWATGLQDVWARGMLTFDTLWYHGPFAARIAETGSVWGLHFTDPLYLNWFYPQNSELLHGAGIVLFDRDLFSPLVNFAWLGVALLAAWCIGRPYGVAPLSLLAVALIVDTGPIVPREAGTPANDMAPIALLLAAAALLINAWAARGSGEGPTDAPKIFASKASASGGPSQGPLLIAGLAMGLALGTKLTIAGPTAAMAVGVPLIADPGFRRRALGLFLGGVAITAGIWFLRNLIHSGSPLPWLQDVGPIDLPGPGRGLEGRDDYSVAHYLFANPDVDVWKDFYKAITNLLGPVWFVLLGATALGATLAVWRPRSAAVRLCGAVAIAGGVAYLFTPLTAAGPEGNPLAFGINLRYLVPAFALGLALVPLEPRLTPERARLPLLIGGIAALLLVTLYSDSAYIWDEPFASKPWAALIGVVLIGVPVGLALLGRIRPLVAAGATAILLLAVAAAGWERQDNYFAHRYDRPEDFRFDLDDAFAWAKDTGGERIAVAGTSGAYNQYGLYGDRLDNYVQYVGQTGPGGNFTRIGKCADFREALNDGGYDYLVTTPDLDLNNPVRARTSPERGWVEGDPAVEEIVRAGRVAVFRLNGELAADGCAQRPPASGR
ncbi:MAG: hypothetical protein ACRDK5_11860 [Solirubrobacterales bacterium]